MSIEKINKGDNLSQSENIVETNIDKLKVLFPEIITDGKIDFKILQEILGNEVEEDEEYFQFNWSGKSKARRESQKPSTGTLRPYPEDSKDWDRTQNLYLEGDNLEVLKLLQKGYSGKVKMIYIDPPYNRGSDLVYKDNYKDNLKNYQEVTGQIDRDGNLMSTNTENDGRFHSKWLSMMYPRLRLARNLLSDDGVLFVSIGVEELSNLKSLINEIFGEDNFVEIFSWVKTSTPPALSTKSRKTNEYILCYERKNNSIKYNGEELDGGDQPLLNSGNSVRELIFPKEVVYFKEDKFPDGLLKSGKNDRVELVHDIEISKGYSKKDFVLKGEFKWTQEFLNEEIEKGTKFVIKSEKLSIRFIRNEEGYKRPTNFIKSKYSSPIINKPNNGVGTNENASSALIELMQGDYFDYPKPVTLIKYLTNFVCKENDIVIDFFAGSSTTGESVLRYNLDNNTKLRYILIQLPEELNVENGNTLKEKEKIKKTIKFLESINKPNNIAEIGKERIRRAATKISEEHPEKAKELDLGFKVFKLDTSNIKGWDGNPDNLDESLFDAQDNIKTNRTEHDVLYEILLKYGLDLTLPIEEKTIEGKTVFSVGYGALFICLANNITSRVAEGIGIWKEELQPEVCRVVFKDSGFTDVEKTNSVQTLKRFGITEIKSI
ncbi:site-specific DNA-methyltransferase [uncultured Algibacter sp.]|uniref:site-specific DNA-methyltransferase n=1 Tax=uncultured Algibacter sp. TaxID=298659 RepID=UPI002606CEDD|nr:site-specific DNA-methyltransferase [uncultured Algibacter sp.]